MPRKGPLTEAQRAMEAAKQKRFRERHKHEEKYKRQKKLLDDVSIRYTGI